MNEISKQKRQLPEAIPDLAKFVLIGREKLNAVRAEIRAIQKVGLAKEVLEQKKVEAQELAEAVLDAEVRTGELLKEIPKATEIKGNQYSDKWKIDNGVENPKPKSEVLKEANIPQKQAERYQFLAEHKEEVETAKKIARNNDSIVTRKMVTDLVAPKKDWQKEAVNRAREQHEQFKQDKSKVVDFKDVQKDKRNLELLAGEFELEVLKIVEKFESLRTFQNLTNTSITELCKALDSDSQQTLIVRLHDAIAISNYFIDLLKEN